MNHWREHGLLMSFNVTVAKISPFITWLVTCTWIQLFNWSALRGNTCTFSLDLILFAIIFLSILNKTRIIFQFVFLPWGSVRGGEDQNRKSKCKSEFCFVVSLHLIVCTSPLNGSMAWGCFELVRGASEQWYMTRLWQRDQRRQARRRRKRHHHRLTVSTHTQRVLDSRMSQKSVSLVECCFWGIFKDSNLPQYVPSIHK